VSLTILNHKSFEVDKALSEKLINAFNLICNEESLEKCSINLKLVDNEEITELNRIYRNKNKPTNVLSFTNEDISKSRTNELGDIAISFEFVEQESKEQNKKFNDHVIHMFIHGIYHILGFDHENDSMADAMEKKEILLLEKLQIKNPYK
tara:strand:+ start:160 stop:609 length:450 start_codon:yes stop_codon:yes gene_type:complete